MAPLNVFISSVSAEFGSYREAVRHLLTRPDVAVKVQEDFIASGDVTLVSLDAYVAQCDIVIHLVGDRTGSPVNAGSLAWLRAQYPDLSARYPALREVLAGTVQASYTQWEAYLALVHKKLLLIACPGPSAVRDTTTYEPTELPAAEQHQQQNEHLRRLHALDSRHSEITFANVDNLVAQVAVSRVLDLLKQATARQPLQNLPYAPLGSWFKGRDPFLRVLREQLLEPTSSPRKALYGLGGIGKTRLAIEYAWQHQAEYSALLFVRADQASSLDTNLAALCGLLAPHPVSPDPRKPDEQLHATLAWLAQHSGWLLILDNVDTPNAVQAAKSWLPKLTGGHVLLTTRVSEWGKHADSLELNVLHPDDAKEFILARTSHRQITPTDETDALALVYDLGQLPLALEHAGAYIDVLHVTLNSYRSRLATNAEVLLTWVDADLTNDYEREIAATWLTTFQELSPAAQALLNRLSWLAADPIPRTLLDVPVPDTIPLDTTLAQRDLVRYSLLTYGANYTNFSVHRLVQLVTRNRLTGAARRQAFVEALGWVNAAFEGDPQDIHNWLTLVPLQPHALEIATKHAPEFNNPEPTGRLMNNLGLLLYCKAQFTEAEQLLRRSLVITEVSYGSKHSTVTVRLNNLALLLNATNRLVEAELLYRRALVIAEASYGSHHPSLANCLSNLAALLGDTNRLVEAESLYRRALIIDEANYGPDHPSVARHLNNLASLLRDTNRLVKAEPLFRRALVINEAIYGLNHPFVATALNNLAGLLQDTNHLAEAEPLFRRALIIDEANYGPHHPNVATGLNNLALLLVETNQLKEAEPLFRRALAITEASYGPYHPTVAAALSNLSSLLYENKKIAEAEPLLRRTLSIMEASYGPDHPKVATALNNLAALLQANNQLDEAELLLRRALIIDETSYGFHHPSVANRLNNLALLFRATNRLEESELFIRRALVINETSYGLNHPGVATGLSSLASLLQAMNRLEEVEPLYRRALAINEVSYGTHHPSVASDLNDLASLLKAKNRFSEAELLYRQALAIYEYSHDPSHPTLANCLENLAGLLQITNRLKEAEPLLRRALAIIEANYGPAYPPLARCFNNLASLLQSTNRLREAKLLYQRCIALHQHTSYDKAYFQIVISNYTSVLLQLGESEIAIRAALVGLGLQVGRNDQPLR